jgi:hypothetical protein
MMGILLLFQFVFANPNCTSWQKDRTVYCYFTDRRADVWVRHCSYGPQQVCSLENPNQFTNQCGTWFQNSYFKCMSQNGRLEDQWLRVCTNNRYSTQFCSDTINPNYQ